MMMLFSLAIVARVRISMAVVWAHGQCKQHQRSQNGQDGDDDEQFD